MRKAATSFLQQRASRSIRVHQQRLFSHNARLFNNDKADFVIGVYENGEATSTAQALLSKQFFDSDFVKSSKWKCGSVKIVHKDLLAPFLNNSSTHVQRIALVGLGPRQPENKEQKDESKKNAATEDDDGEPKIEGNFDIKLNEQFFGSSDALTSSMEQAEGTRDAISAAVKALLADEQQSDGTGSKK